MKKYLIILLSGLSLTSCNDWLDVLPKNEQVTENYWKTKEDVEQVIAAGYYYMRETTPYLIDWGELRGASIYAPKNEEKIKLQDFQLVASSSLCKWEKFYQVINMANSVLQYAPTVHLIDDTYPIESMKSHQTEAYFMRALMYFYLVRNFKEVPLVLDAYVDDSAPYNLPKSTEQEILDQIKQDITTAIESGAAKEFFEHSDWANPTKGRATRWALYALMADVCLWSEDYDEAIIHVNMLLEADHPYMPAFMTDGEQWTTMFLIGNTNEAIFELNWDSSNFGQITDSPSSYYGTSDASVYKFTEEMNTRLRMDNLYAELYNGTSIRGENATYKDGLLWKYVGNGSSVRTTLDANLIIYRMAEMLLIKAEALIWKGETYWQEAMDLINQVRVRANLNAYTYNLADFSELNMLELLLEERDMELAGENKRWYDLVRFGKTQNFKYKSNFINEIVANNSTASSSWLRSVLENNYAWYLPIPASEIEVNDLLEQNPYYKTTN